MNKKIVFLFALTVFIISSSCSERDWWDEDYFKDYLTGTVWSEFIEESWSYSVEQTLTFNRNGTGVERFYYYDDRAHTYDYDENHFYWERVSDTSRNIWISFRNGDEFEFRITTLDRYELTGWYGEDYAYFTPR